jgi:hypothetical protein
MVYSVTFEISVFVGYIVRHGPAWKVEKESIYLNSKCHKVGYGL